MVPPFSEGPAPCAANNAQFSALQDPLSVTENPEGSSSDSPPCPAVPTPSPTAVLPTTVPFRRTKYAYATLLTRDTYLPGAQCLARSLRAAGAAHPLLVLHTLDTLSATAAAVMSLETGVVMRPVARYHPPPGTADARLYKLPAYSECWNKLRLFELEGEFDRIVYLDADMLVLRNLDHLFELPEEEDGGGALWAAPDCAAGRETLAERAACALLRSRPHYFNAGLMVLRPSTARFHSFGAALHSGTARVGGYAEQDLLNSVFEGTWAPLPPSYNLQKGIKGHHPELWAPSSAHVLHFTDDKPWVGGMEAPQHAEHADIVSMWWQAYEAGRR
jgi:inositol 3-alpha-galactosyltransferase